MGMRTSVTATDVERMADRLYVTAGDDRNRKWSAYWILLALSAVIAGAGVLNDSTATVIGAMIVAPLMTPILGTALALVLANRRYLVHNLLLALAGAALVVAVGFALGLTSLVDVVAETNTQVASRVSPNLRDLVAALATGMVGAFAVVRSDVSDTLPGVAIAISLVPPLAVAGLTLESGAPGQAAGALLLFGTNVAAIIATGTAVLLAYRVRHVAREAGLHVRELSGRTLAIVAGTVVAVAIPLSAGSWHVLREQLIVASAQPVAVEWAESQGWRITEVEYRNGVLRIVALGALPEARSLSLRADLDAAGLQDVPASVTLLVGGTKDLPVTD